MYPKVGEEVLLRHTVDYDKAGNPMIVGARRHEMTTVTAVYHDGSVRVASGDKWKVTRISPTRLATVSV